MSNQRFLDSTEYVGGDKCYCYLRALHCNGCNKMFTTAVRCQLCWDRLGRHIAKLRCLKCRGKAEMPERSAFM